MGSDGSVILDYGGMGDTVEFKVDQVCKKLE